MVLTEFEHITIEGMNNEKELCEPTYPICFISYTQIKLTFTSSGIFITLNVNRLALN